MMVPMRVPMPRVMAGVISTPFSYTAGWRTMFRAVASVEPMK